MKVEQLNEKIQGEAGHLCVMHINHSEFDRSFKETTTPIFCLQVQENYYKFHETSQIATFDGVGVGFGKFFIHKGRFCDNSLKITLHPYHFSKKSFVFIYCCHAYIIKTT